MEKEEILKELYDAILALNKVKAETTAKELIKTDIDPSEAVENWMAPAMEEMGRRFQSGELFLPELQLSADVFQGAMRVIQPRLIDGSKDVKPRGRILLGTVKGDLHSIGKDLVSTMLKISGFEVIDLGVDISTLTFLDEAQKNEVDIIGLSALLTTTIPIQGEIVEALVSHGLREQFQVMVGGGPVDQRWADQIGADGYGENAAQAVDLAKKLSP